MVRKKVTADELNARARENGYQRGVHQENDCLRDRNKHVDRVKAGSEYSFRSLRPVRGHYLHSKLIIADMEF
jgi:hypothetical protein